jgi:hypothetical protein
MAELDLPVHCGAAIGPDGVRVTMRQNGSDVCRVDVTVAGRP